MDIFAHLFFPQVCPLGVSKDRAVEEYTHMAEVLVQASASAGMQLPLTSLLVQVRGGTTLLSIMIISPIVDE
jgi:hypothetical protein